MTTRAKARYSRKLGEAGESVIRRHLERMGYRMVERIETGWRVFRQGKQIVRAVPLAKVAGDFRGVGDGGRSMLAEGKTRCGKLLWSDLEPHQRAALDTHAEAGGESLLAWYDPDTGDVRVYAWPVEGFGPGKSLKAERRAA